MNGVTLDIFPTGLVTYKIITACFDLTWCVSLDSVQLNSIAFILMVITFNIIERSYLLPFLYGLNGELALFLRWHRDTGFIMHPFEAFAQPIGRRQQWFDGISFDTDFVSITSTLVPPWSPAPPPSPAAPPPAPPSAPPASGGFWWLLWGCGCPPGGGGGGGGVALAFFFFLTLVLLCL